MHKPVLIFDFDGTIVDSMKYILQVVNELATTYRFEKIKEEDVAKLRKYNMQKLFDHIKLPFYKKPFFIYSVRKKIAQNIHRVELFPGIKEVLIQLKINRHPLAILTNNSRNTVKKFLKINNLEIFDYIYAENIISIWFGKYRLINKFLRQNHIANENAIYIGDEIEDIKNARKSKIKIISVCWGYNSCDALKEHHPDYIATVPQDILEILKE